MSKISDSPLLRCLGQLNDDVWTEILLPKLLANGSAPAAALTCSRLRQLCQRSRQQLKIKTLDTADSTSAVSRWIQQLPQRFPACSSVFIRLICHLSHQQSCPAVPVIVDMLSRMPALTSLALALIFSQQPLALAMIINSISSRLPRLQDLTLVSTESWEDGAQQVWEQLGSITQLTSLKVHFDNHRVEAVDTSKGCLLPHLAPLRNLTGLQQLHITSCKQLQHGGEEQGQQGGGFEFLGELTALTDLEIAVPSTHGFTSISSCTALQRLWLRPVRNSSGGGCLSDEDWEAVGQLGHLTELHINMKHQPRSLSAQQPFYAALQKLSQLHSVGDCIWTAAALPILAGLPRLRHVSGLWSGIGDAAGARCEQVTSLQISGNIDIDINIATFPNLEVFCHLAGVTAEMLQSMSTSCPKLRSVWGSPDSLTGVPEVTQAHKRLNSCGSFRDFVEPPARLSALRSLSQLTALTRLSFKSNHYLEVAALADVVPYVRELHIVALSGVDCMCLTPLAKLAGKALTSLYLYFAEFPVSLTAALHVHVLLSALSRVPKVVVVVQPAAAASVEGAVQSARAVGVSLPVDLSVVSIAAR